MKVFIQQRYHISGLRKTLLSIKYRCFLCRRFAAQSIQPVMAPLPACRLPTYSTLYPFENSGVDFFGTFYIENAKGQIEKHYGLIFICLVTRCVHLEACPDLNTDCFLNAYRRFVSRRCQPTAMLSDNGKTFIGASEELKRCVKRLDNDKIYKALAATNTMNVQCSLWTSVWRYLGAFGPDRKTNSIDHSRLQKIVT